MNDESLVVTWFLKDPEKEKGEKKKKWGNYLPGICSPWTVIENHRQSKPRYYDQAPAINWDHAVSWGRGV